MRRPFQACRRVHLPAGLVRDVNDERRVVLHVAQRRLPLLQTRHCAMSLAPDGDDGDVTLRNVSFVLNGERLPFNKINGTLHEGVMLSTQRVCQH